MDFQIQQPSKSSDRITQIFSQSPTPVKFEEVYHHVELIDETNDAAQKRHGFLPQRKSNRCHQPPMTDIAIPPRPFICAQYFPRKMRRFFAKREHSQNRRNQVIEP
jgi:hypothetical protein